MEQPMGVVGTSATTAVPLPDVDLQGHLVAAGRVDVVHLGLERVAKTRARCGRLECSRMSSW